MADNCHVVQMTSNHIDKDDFYYGIFVINVTLDGLKLDKSMIQNVCHGLNHFISIYDRCLSCSMNDVKSIVKQRAAL